MGVLSTAQVKAKKMEAKAAANKTGKHRSILTRKKLKRERNQERNKKKKESMLLVGPKPVGAETESRQREERGRSSGSKEDAVLDRDESMRQKSRPVKPGHGSGTAGARAASAKVPKAVQVSKRGGRRRKATWRAFGKG
eukprot:TRINITY_DN6782_c0_g1_i2.p1 TRINITY_DN6782_c0_g1~~TRINITY_DN6782_c0_g1_i2.p1  ORF type:complete len:139 (+),score=36.19 TRINITY_DN6782_c0_g1_i2:100-516(+)